MDEQEAVWAETTDGGLLKQLFGYFPTLHDARIRLLEIDKSGRVTMTLDYEDQVEGSPDLRARIRLVWEGVGAMELTLGESDLSGMKIRRAGDLIRSEFEFGIGSFGFIESERFEATLEKLDPPPGDDQDDRMTLRYR